MMQANTKIDPRIERALSVMAGVRANLDEAASALVARLDKAVDLIREFDQKLPEAILKSLVTGDRSDLDALYAQRAQAERDIKDCETVKPLFDRYERQVAIRRGLIRDGKFSMLPPGEPEMWFPAFLTAGSLKDQAAVK
jgi:hypothetical protein